MRHLYFCTSYPSYSETFVATEMEALVEQGDDVLVYSLRRPPQALTASVRYLAQPCGWIRLAFWAPVGGFLLARAVLRGLRFRPRSLPRLFYAASHAARASIAIKRHGLDGEIDVVHAHFLDRPADVAAMVQVDAKARLVTVHASDGWRRHDRALHRWRLSSFDRLICASEYVRRGLGSQNGGRFPVVHCGVGVGPRLDRVTGGLFKTVRVCTVARLIPTKNHAYAIAVLDELVRLGISVEWHVVGDGPQMAELRRYAGSARQGLRVHLHGAQPHSNALQIVRSCDVMILPSKVAADGSDGIPVAMMEAMAAGVLVISTPVGGIPELVIDGVTGILGDPEDPLSCAAALNAVLTTPAHRKAIVSRAFEHVSADFNAVHSAQGIRVIAASVASGSLAGVVSR